MPAFYCSEPVCKRRWHNFERKAESAKCPSCHRPASILKRVPKGLRAYILKEFPEHWNHSMGCIVRSRKHHQQLQRERGLQDWQPTNNSPGSQLSMGRRH